MAGYCKFKACRQMRHLAGAGAAGCSALGSAVGAAGATVAVVAAGVVCTTGGATTEAVGAI